jgi:L-alanine-DL-glutamate epimerase-like enolase superfamily enzyme
MLIKKVDVYPLSYAIGDQQLTQRYFALIKITTDEGIFGWGEASDCYGHHIPLTVKAYVQEQLQWWLLDQDPLQIESLISRVRAQSYRYQGNTELVMQVISGIEMALWDIRGKVMGLPVSTILGAYRKQIPIYAGDRPVFDISTEQHLEWIQPHLDHGVKAVKVRIGNTFEWDKQFVRAMRKLLPADVRLLVDGKYNYTPDSAIRMSYVLADEGVDCFEEPVIPMDLDELARVAAASVVPLAYGEHSFTIYDFRELILRDIARVLNPDASICGGITAAVDVSKLAQAFGFNVSPHCGGLSAIGMAANIHAAAAMPVMDVFEFDSRLVQPLRDELPLEPIFSLDKIIDGCMPVPTGPGLGIEVNEEIIDKYPYKVNEKNARAFYVYGTRHI